MNNQEPSSFEPGEQTPTDLSQGPAEMQPQQSSPEPPGEYRQFDPVLDRPVGAGPDHVLPTTQPETYRVSGPYLGSGWRQRHPTRQRSIKNSLTGLAGLIILILLFGSMLSVTIYSIGTNLSNVKDSLTHTFPLLPVGQRPHLIVRDDNGSIHIQGKHVGIITVQAIGFVSGVGLYRKPIAVHYTQHNGISEVDATLQPDILFVGIKGIDLTITVPITSDVEAYLQAGSIQAENIQGQVTLETAAGSLIAKNVQGPLAVQAGMGPITVDGLVGKLNASAQNGKISVGQTTLQGQSQLATQAGSISFNGTLDRHGTYNFTAHAGYVDIALPVASAFQLDAFADGGKIANGFGHTHVGKGLLPALIVTTDGDAITLRRGLSFLLFT